MKSTLSILAVAALSTGLAFHIYQQGRKATPSVIQSAPPAISTSDIGASAAKTVMPTNAADALHDLLGAPLGATDFKSSGRISRVWFGQPIHLDSKDFYAVFIKSQQLDEAGNLLDCHPCGVDVGVMTYLWSGTDWRVLARQPVVAGMGAWGDAGRDVELAGKPGRLELSPGHMVLTLETGFMNQGISSRGARLFAFDGKAWHDFGLIETSGDNEGDCDEEGTRACWEFTGKIVVVPAKDSAYPDLRVVREGTEPGLDGVGVVPARDVTYVFDGQVYAARSH